MDPTLVMGAMGALKPAGAGPSAANGNSAGSSTNNGSNFDGSGWTVSTGSSKAQGGSAGFNTNTLLIVGAVVVGALYLLRKGH